MPAERAANEALERRVAELAASNEQLRQEITRAEAALAHAHREAERSSRLKDEFLATLAHELRTPLNAIFGWVTLLRSGRLDAPTGQRALETIERNARAQKRLIEDSLEMSRIVSGKLTLELHAVDLRRVIEAALETLLPAAQAKSVRLRSELMDETATLHGDFARLQQVVCNLLSNSIKFSDSGSEVEVSLTRQAATAQIAVRDHGQGIRAEFLPHVFERFRQEGAGGAQPGGLGIGLAIVRHLVELHGGAVAAESPGEGQGATFTVRLPVDPPA